MLELGVIGLIVMVNVSRLGSGKGFFIFKIFGFNITVFIKTRLNSMKLFREIKVNQIKKMRNVNVRSCVFMMFQMISIWN